MTFLNKAHNIRQGLFLLVGIMTSLLALFSNPALAEDRVYKVGIAERVLPFAKFDKNGQMTGVFADYLALAEKKTGLKLKAVQVESDTRQEVMQLFNDKKIDIVIADINDPAYKNRALSTAPFLSSPIMVIGSEDLSHVNTPYELENAKNAIIKNVGFGDQLRLRYPQLNFVEVFDEKEGLYGVETAKFDTFFSPEYVAGYFLKEWNLNRLNPITLTGVDLLIGFYTQNDLPNIKNQLENFTVNMTQKEHHAIKAKWAGDHFIEKTDYTIAIIISIFALIIITSFLLWNRKLKEEVLLRKQAEKQAAQANKLKSEFLANMSHEIRTPMNAVLGFTGLMKNTELTGKQEQYLRAIETGGKTLLALINDILDLSKIEAGMLKIESTEIDLHAIISDMPALFRDKTKQKSIYLKTHIAEEVPQFILGDEVRIRQIMLNLVSNAIKFTETGGVTIEAHWLNNTLVIKVIDTGIGIPKDQIDKIFAAFVQQEGQSNRQYGGTGLGLSISTKLAKLMQGQLQVASEGKEKGSTFSLELNNLTPIASQHAQSKANQAQVRLTFKNQKVLIVDDKPLNLILLNEILSDMNLQVLEADNGQTALNTLRSQQIDAVLSDIRMPVMDGYELIAEIRKTPEFKSLGVFAVTASVMKEEKDNIVSKGFDGVLDKPIDLQKLQLALSQFLEVDEQNQQEISINETQQEADLQSLSPEVIKALQDKGAPLLSSTKMSDLSAFFDECQTIIKQHPKADGIDDLQQVSEQLKQSIDQFDIDQMETIKKQFLVLWSKT